MAAEILLKQGTTLVWTSSGGDNAMDMSSLANDAARQGAKDDLGATRAAQYEVVLQYDTGSVAPTAGETVDVFWASSDNATAGTNNPGGTGGTDSAYTGYSTDLDDSLENLIFLGSLVVTNNADQIHRQTICVFSPPNRYGFPVVVNRSGQTAGSTGTDHRVEIHPIIDESQ